MVVTVFSCSALAYDVPSCAENVDASAIPEMEDTEAVTPRSTVYYTISEPLGAYMLTGAGSTYSRVRSSAFPYGLSVIHILTQKGSDGYYWIKCSTVPNSALGETTSYTGWIRKDLLTYSGSV
jgi:hypothetical protein